MAPVIGAERLQEILTQLDGDPGALSAAAGQWTATTTAAGSTGDLVGTRVTALDAAWSGAGAEAVVAWTAGLRGGLDQVGPAADAVAAALTAAGGALEAASTAVQAIVDQVSADCAAVALTSEPAVLAAVAAIVQAATGRAEEHLGTAQDALSRATQAITAASAATPFTGLPPIAEQRFEPAHFAVSDWTVEVPASTSAQGTHVEPVSAHVEPVSAHGGGSGGNGAGGGGSGGGSGGGGGGVDSGGGPPSGGGGSAAPAQVQRWIDEAMKVLQDNGVDTSKLSRDDIWTMIQHESGGDPHAINDWDSNAAQGTPSKGIMQTIGPTFDSYKVAGHDDIWNPVDNIVAACRYTLSRYGSTSGVPGIEAIRGGGAYQGY
ncbi:transglycosylase SLT domain-containing protein [Rhodococcus antarcticus]|uniref:Transglycosylase SLT domain-containing protein n=1 Tax=Rhodococcus antarcticus TaxID=2987751 RepID=A0ABY6P051_9NOCA|nr:transglycosylase SLT domain-containing protein [Rhodococcus antarcticus]UZJ25044.1 transglycosylase SLT domain-containing protein [Rhodococcus antarcticus]